MAKLGSNIYKRKDGRYEGRITVGYDENNKIKYKYIYGRTLAEVKDKMAETYANKEYLLKSKSKLTVRELGDQWLENKRITIRVSTFSIYSSILNNYIYPNLGGLRYTALTKLRINALISDLLSHGKIDESSGLSPKTVRDIIIVLKSVSSYAHIEHGLENVCENIKSPKNEYKEIQALSREERKILDQYLRTNLTITNVCILLCLYTGIRIGELCALQWKDIDFESSRLNISKTIQRISDGNGKTKIVIGSPKTKMSNRKVPVPQFILHILAQFKSLPTIYLLSGDGVPIEPRTMQYRFKSVLDSCKMRNVNFHTLRHTYATMCVENGFDAKSLSEILGHADVSITLNRYVHSSDRIQQQYVSQLEFIS